MSSHKTNSSVTKRNDSHKSPQTKTMVTSPKKNDHHHHHPNVNEKESPKKSETKDNSLETIAPTLKPTEKKAQRTHSDFELKAEAIEFLKKKGYEIRSEIGEGSYGKVYRAFNEQFDTDVAIKIMDIERFTQLFINKFLKREIAIMKNMKGHAHITKYHKVFKENGLFYIIMERASNGDLFNYILKRRYIPEYQACVWFKQLINGVEHIHKSGFAHRDLKCENLLLDDNYNIKISDFGFCCHIGVRKHTRASSPTPLCKSRQKVRLSSQSQEVLSKTFCGSYIYASPELLRGVPYSPVKTDIWSCGVVLYVMLFGSYPYDGHDLQKFIDDPNCSIKMPENPKVSDECKDLLHKIFKSEDNRISIAEIKKWKWFKRVWDENEKSHEKDPKVYFENLGIPRTNTEPFNFIRSKETGTLSADSVEKIIGGVTDLLHNPKH